MSRPLRLTAEEALALVVALRTLGETRGLAESDAIKSALAKVETAAGGAVDDSTVTVELDHDERLLVVLHRAIEDRRALRLVYYSASRDETGERIVDPLRVFDADGRTYLEAWCRQAEGMRLFRLDRIEDAEVLAEPARIPDDVQPRDLSEGVFRPASEHLLVELRLSPAYAWVADYYVAQDVVEEGEQLRVSLRVADPGWVRALVLGSAGQVEVLSPDWLAEGIRAEAARALTAYAAK
jgi:proteasome accessory factor C